MLPTRCRQRAQSGIATQSGQELDAAMTGVRMRQRPHHAGHREAAIEDRQVRAFVVTDANFIQALPQTPETRPES